MQISVINTEQKESKNRRQKYRMRIARNGSKNGERDSMARGNKLCCLCDPLLVRYAPTLFPVQSKTTLDDFDVLMLSLSQLELGVLPK